MPETSGWIIVTEIIPGCEASKRHYDQQPRFSCATRSAVRIGVTIGLLGLVLMVRFAMPMLRALAARSNRYSPVVRARSELAEPSLVPASPPRPRSRPEPADFGSFARFDGVTQLTQACRSRGAG